MCVIAISQCNMFVLGRHTHNVARAKALSPLFITGGYAQEINIDNLPILNALGLQCFVKLGIGYFLAIVFLISCHANIILLERRTFLVEQGIGHMFHTST
jgi:hypothetical protein